MVLTLGLGAITAIFHRRRRVLRGLPFEDADRLVAVGERPSGPPKGKGMPGAPIGPPVADASDPLGLTRLQPQNYLDWVAQQQVFESIAAVADLGEFTFLAGGEPENLNAHRVTASFFDVLRVRPALGRAFTIEHETDGRQRVAILSDAFWRRRFGADPNVIGRALTLDGDPYEVIGVMAPGVTYPVGSVRPAELWVPYVVPPNERVRGRGVSIYLQSIARLKPGVSVARAQANMDQIAEAVNQANPDQRIRASFGVRPLRDHLVGASMTTWMLMLLAAVGIVLLIACANVANLMLARANARELRSLSAGAGAGRFRLMRQSWSKA